MKKKLLKSAGIILTSIMLVPIFVLGAVHLPELFPRKPKPEVEEVKIYQPLDLNERYNYKKEDLDKLTDKDEFTYISEDDLDISDYRDKNLFASTTYFYYKNFNRNEHNTGAANSNNGFTYSTTGDDPIVNLIPRQIFNCRGDYLWIGKEWGFFARTESAGIIRNESSETFGYLANFTTVLVFDITQTKLRDIGQREDTISSSVTVLFQYEYAFLKKNSDGEFGFGHSTESNVLYKGSQEDLSNNGNTLVIARPQNVSTPYSGGQWSFVESDRFALTDIAFRKDLVNEQHPDKHLDFGVRPTVNTNYVPENDKGNFIIRADYSFQGTNPADRDLLGILRSAFGIAVGFIPVAGNAISLAYSGIDISLEANNLSRAGDPVVSYDGSLGAQSFYTTKADQLKYYGNLTKSATIGLPTAVSSKSVLFRSSGQYAKAEFTLSRNEEWQTRVQNTVYLRVADYDTEINNVAFEKVAENYGTYVDYADDKAEYKESEVNITNRVSILPDGNDYYAFKPEYSGNYTFRTTDSVNTEIEVWKEYYDSNGNVVKEILGTNKGNSNSLNVELAAGSEYKIKIALADKQAYASFDFWIEFSPEEFEPGTVKNIELDPQTHIFYEFKAQNVEPYTIMATAGKELANLEIKVYDEYLNQIVNYNGTIDGDYVGQGQISALFKPSLANRYYIGIFNANKEGPRIEAELKAIAPKEILLNESHEMGLYGSVSQYYSFKPSYSGNYRFTSSNVSALSVYSNTLFLLKNSDKNFIEYFLIENQTYYFEINKGYAGRSTQTITLDPLAVKFGENDVFNEQGYTWYSFTPKMDGEYELSSSDLDTAFSIYIVKEINEKNELVILEGQNDKYALEKDAIYYIMQSDNGDVFNSVRLSIGLITESFTLNNDESYSLNDNGYINLMFETKAEGWYSFEADCDIAIHGSDLSQLWSGSGSLRASLFNGRKYYIHLSGDAGAEVNFKAVFDPYHISLNLTNAISGNISSKYFQYISESENEHTVYTFGDSDIKTEIVIYDENLSEIDRFDNAERINNTGHVSFKYSFILGEKYYIQVNRVSGVGPFGFKVEELFIPIGYHEIYEGEKKDGPDSSFNTRNFKFVAQKTSNFEIRLNKNRYDNFIIKLYNMSTGEYEVLGAGTDRYFGETEIMKVYTCDLTAGIEYIISIDSVNVDVKAPVLSVVVPITSAELTFNGAEFDAYKVINVRQDGNYSIEISTNQGASLFEPVLMFDRESSIGNFVWDGQYAIIFNVYEFAPVGDTISLLIQLDNFEFSIITFKIEYKYELGGGVFTDESTGISTYRIFNADDQNRSAIQSLNGVDSINIVTEVRYKDGALLYTLPWDGKFTFDLSALNYDRDIKIISTLYFAQGGNAFNITLETEHFYHADYTSLANLINGINTTSKKVIFVSISGATGNSGTTSNPRIITIPVGVQVLNIKGVRNYIFTDVWFQTLSRTTKLTLNFADFSFTASANANAIAASCNLDLNIIGSCTISGGTGRNGNSISSIKGGIGINVSSLTIKGTISGIESLTVNGGSGGNGSGTYQAQEYSPGGYYYVTKTMCGGEGGRGISCTNLTADIFSLTVNGGSGGIGAVNDGSHGTAGGYIPGNGTGEKGGDGTKGMDGGVGGNGAYGIYCTSITNNNANSITIKGGSGGKGGAGGRGGDGGAGGNGTNYKIGVSLGRYGGDGGNGGNGGTGGKGGNAYAGINSVGANNTNKPNAYTNSNGSPGSGGARGSGGNGGAGGHGGKKLTGYCPDGNPGSRGYDGGYGSSGTTIY